jgi:archaemetzincin
VKQLIAYYLIDMKLLFYFFLVLLFISCKTQQKKEQHTTTTKRPVVILQTMQFTDTATLRMLKDSIEAFYKVTVKIAPDKKFPDHLYYKPRNRYRADRIIHWLRMNIGDSIRTVVGITTKDVSTTKGDAYDYGVMGLGYRPGQACVVSTYRLAKTARNNMHLQQRLLKLVIHEMGHNFGLPHCSNEECFMVDAEGQMKLDSERYLCNNCFSQLRF